MTGPSDDYILNGEWHTCVCGARWSDSDGGPCHSKCDNCGDIVDDEAPCGCAILGISLRLLRRCEIILRVSAPDLAKELTAEIEEMRVRE
jgi:hypothetical protein